MRKELFLALGMWFLCAGIAPAQEAPLALPACANFTLVSAETVVPALVAEASDPASPDSAPATPDNWFPPAAALQCGPRVWGSADYLLWWIKGAPVGVPLVTTGPTTGAGGGVGVVGAAGTNVILGGGTVNFGSFSGGRFTVGGWLDAEQTFGVEGSYLFLAQQSVQRTVASPGTPPLGVPFFNVATGAEDSVALNGVSGGQPFTGTGTLTISSKLQGAELNTLFRLTCANAPLQLQFLAGFRYLNLEESLDFATSSPFLNAPNSVFVTNDHFDTRNQFYGGQLGGRAEYSFGKISVQATGKVALGDMHEQVRTNGVLLTNDFAGGALQTFPGGYFALPTNSGSVHHDRFAVVPEVDFNVSYQLTRHVRTFVGYSFLYASDVVRPGNQLDRNINPSQSANFTGNGNATLAGPAAPQPHTNSSSFWTQGINLGVQLRF